MGCAIAQAFSGPVIESVDRIVDLLLCHFQEAGLLGKELAQQAIVILVEPPFPRAVRMCKVHLGLQALGDELVLGKLLAVVKGQRLALRLVGPEQFDNRLCHASAMARVQPAGQGIAGLALHQGDKNPLVALADDGVTLPVANAAALAHHAGALLDANAVLEHASSLLATGVAFAAYFLASQVLDPIATLGLVEIGSLVNAFVADGDGLLQLQSSTALLGR